MITSKKLLEIAKQIIPYGRAEMQQIGYEGELPEELADKLGTFRFEQPTVAVLENVDLAGPTGVCFYDNDVVLDVAYYGRWDVLERNRVYYDYALQCKGEEPVKLEGAWCNLAGVWSGNYYHWILESLTKLEGVLEYERQTGEKVSILTHTAPAKYVTDSLEAAGFNSFKRWILHEPHYQVEKLIIPSQRRRQGRTAKGAIEYLHSLAGDLGNHLEDFQYYISRKDASVRRIVNEAEILEALSSYEIIPVQPEQLSLPSQIASFRTASTIIGMHGSGLVNMVWAKNPRVIEIMTPDYINPCFFTICAAMGWRYDWIMGRPVEGQSEDVWVDVEELKRVLFKQEVDFLMDSTDKSPEAMQFPSLEDYQKILLGITEADRKKLLYGEWD